MRSKRWRMPLRAFVLIRSESLQSILTRNVAERGNSNAETTNEFSQFNRANNPLRSFEVTKFGDAENLFARRLQITGVFDPR